VSENPDATMATPRPSHPDMSLTHGLHCHHATRGDGHRLARATNGLELVVRGLRRWRARMAGPHQRMSSSR